MFDAIVIEKPDGEQTVRLAQLGTQDLPQGDVLVDVAFSTLNYKDALAITGASPVVRSFPMVPGVDFSGVVKESGHPEFKPGDRVILNGWGVGEKHWGGLAGQARVKGDWLVPVPEAISLRQAMAIGTAGYTAMLCVMALERHGVRPESGEVVVTGAAGGVGSVAVALLAARGYTVAAVTGRPSEAEYLTGLGAASIIDRAELSVPGRPLAKERWAGRRRGSCQGHRRHALSWCRCLLRFGRQHGSADKCLPLHPARRHARRYRQRHVPEARSRGGLVQTGRRTRHDQP